MEIKLKDYLINILSPPRCISCNGKMPLTTTAMFCYHCGKEYYLNNKTVCNICGKPINPDGDIYCVKCKNTKTHYIKNVSRYLYKGSVKNAIQNMKFKRRTWISYQFGEALSKTVIENYQDIKFDIVLYVPMSPLNERRRGFNQSGEIASIVADRIEVPISHKILYKKPGIKTQSSLSRKERTENIKNAFFVKNAHLLEDKVVLLIDDVFTTGSTINECSRILQKNGAIAIYTATVATVTTEE